jgi:hypothetical protein
MLVKLPYIKQKVRGLSWRIFNFIENNGNANFDLNGERVFIENLYNFFNTNGGGRK